MELTNIEILVIVGGAGLIGLILYYFFGPKNEMEEAIMDDKTQKASIVVDAAYIPSEISLKVNVPAEITFDRKDSGDCTQWVTFENLPTKEKKTIKSELPEGAKTTVSFTPTEIGEYKFVCGMGMVHGKLTIK